MVRPVRPDYTNTYHHVVIRGLNGLPIFDNSEKREKFLKIVKGTRKKHDLAIYAFGFLNTHWHGFVRRKGIAMARFFQTIKSGYAGWYNKKYARTGSPYDGRYFSSIVDSETYFSMVWNYVQNQGVKGGLYEVAVDDPGSTAGLYAGISGKYKWIDWKEALRLLDIPEKKKGKIYENWLAEQEVPDRLPARKKRNQYFIASDKYIEKYMQIRRHKVRKASRLESPLSWETLLKGVKVLYNYKVETVLEPSKKPQLHCCRAGIAYAARRYGHKTTGEISEKLKVSESAISRMIKKAIQSESGICEKWDSWIKDRNAKRKV